MPKIMFVNEHREVEIQAGRLISDVAKELGIQVCREEFAGTGFGDYTVWVKGDSGCLSPLTFYEKFIKRCKGQRRMANRAKVLKDVEVWTQGGMTSRQNVPRPLAPAPRAGEDGSERFDHPNNAAGTAWHVYGHPHAIGSGTRDPKVYEPPQKKGKAAKPKADAAKPKAAAKPKVADADDADDASEEDVADTEPKDAAKPKAEAKPSAADDVDESADDEAADDDDDAT